MTDIENQNEDQNEDQNAGKQVVAAKRRRRRQVTPKEAVERQTSSAPKRVRIILEENDAIPPTGLPIGHNGRVIVIMPGEIVDIPEHYLEILDNAITSVPVKDPQTLQVVGERPRMRYPYRRL